MSRSRLPIPWRYFDVESARQEVHVESVGFGRLITRVTTNLFAEVEAANHLTPNGSLAGEGVRAVRPPFFTIQLQARSPAGVQSYRVKVQDSPVRVDHFKPRRKPVRLYCESLGKQQAVDGQNL